MADTDMPSILREDQNRRKDDGRIAALEIQMASMSSKMDTVISNTEEITAFFNFVRGTNSVLMWVGHAGTWITRVAATIIILYAIYKGNFMSLKTSLFG